MLLGTTSRVGVSIAAIAWLGWMASGAAQRPEPPPIPAKAGVAAGSLTAGALKVTLTHAYALGPVDLGGPLYQVLLTDGPIAADALKAELRPGAQPLLKAGKLRGIALLTDEKGAVRSIVPFIGALDGSRMISGGESLQAFSVKQGQATGQGSVSTAGTMGQGWSYAASWNAVVIKP
jgi:hypothetical protein